MGFLVEKYFLNRLRSYGNKIYIWFKHYTFYERNLQLYRCTWVVKFDIELCRVTNSKLGWNWWIVTRPKIRLKLCTYVWQDPQSDLLRMMKGAIKMGKLLLRKSFFRRNWIKIKSKSLRQKWEVLPSQRQKYFFRYIYRTEVV